MSSSVRWSWRLAARVSTSASSGRQGEGNRSRRSAGGEAGEFNERNRMVAEQKGSARCSRAHSVCVKCSTQERWGLSSRSTTGSGG